MILSFGWTWPAFVAGAKTVTRRDWSPDYARRWKAGTEFTAYNRSPRFGGQIIGRGRVLQDVVREPLAAMPDADYQREGFEWLRLHPAALPKAARQQPWGECTRSSFEDWRNSGDSLYVIRFEVLSISDYGRDRLLRVFEPEKIAETATLGGKGK